MGLDIIVNDAPKAQSWGDRFFAIRIGTGASNEIVIAENTPGVQEHHCTIVHTGSTYRLEMLPTHLVFVDGERGECGQQLFLRDNNVCTLSIGGAPLAGRAVQGGARRAPSRLAPPPKIELRKTGGATPVPPRPDQQGRKTNRDISRYIRISVRNLVIALAVLALGGAAAFGWSAYDQLQIRRRLDEVASLSSAIPSAEVMAKARRSVFQIGLVKGGDFSPTGTAWLWDGQGASGPDPLSSAPRLVTNIHVVSALFNCARSDTDEAAAKCGPVQSGRPAIRFLSDGDPAKGAQVVPLAGPCDPAADDAGAASLTALVHADHASFDHWLRLNQEVGPPNVYDIAYLPWPAGCIAAAGWSGGPLSLAKTLADPHNRPASGVGVAILGYPAEGKVATDLNAPTAQFRAGWIGRTSDPFGLPAPEEDLLVLTGPEVIGGESGSPVIDRDGQVVAMVFANYSQTAGDQTRIPFGGRMKALSARLLLEADRMLNLDADNPGPTPERLRAWKSGLTSQSVDRRDVLLRQFRDWKCQPGVPKEQEETRIVTAEQPATFPKDSSAGIAGWASSGEFTISGPPGYASNLLLMASSVDDTPHEVTVSTRVGEYSGFMASSDPTATLASAPARLDETGFVYSAQRPSHRVSYMVFSPLEAGRRARFKLEIHRIDCLPEAPP